MDCAIVETRRGAPLRDGRMSASSYPNLKFAKTRPRVLDKADRDKRIVSTDKAEDKIVKARSKGQCEVFVVGVGRCNHRALHVHHLQGGSGRRARNTSALWANNLHAG